MPRFALCALALHLALALPVLAGPVAYRLDPDASTVAFETDFGPDRITGAIPLARATLRSTSTMSATAPSRSRWM